MKLTKYRIRIKPEYKDDLHPNGFCIILGTDYAADIEGILRIHRGNQIVKLYAKGVWVYIEQEIESK